jgi:hypothetical protein
MEGEQWGGGGGKSPGVKNKKGEILNLYIKVPDRQCTYNVTLRRVRVTSVVVEKQ